MQNSQNLIAIGYQALIELFQLQTIPHFQASYVALSRSKREYYKNEEEIVYLYPKEYLLKDPKDPFLNLEFALKHEGMNLLIIGLTFQHLSIESLKSYITGTLTGKSQRKVWYLYEFLMNKQLEIPDIKVGNYIDLIDSKLYYSTNPIKKQRQRINDNMLGNSLFCPFVRKTANIQAYEKMQLDKTAKDLLADFEPFIIERAASYLYTKETLSSWNIEHEEPTQMRAINFVRLLRRVRNIDHLDKKTLIDAQNTIVDQRFAESDYRINQNYISESGRRYSIIHYISPKPEDVHDLMRGLIDSLERMIASQVHPVIIAAIISFGFVYIHPFEDGNGRIHRFIIHYILYKTGFTPSEIIFPVSAIMLSDRKRYDQTLESYSKPLMELLNYEETDSGRINVTNNDRMLYAYIDYTKHVEYLFECIKATIDTDLKKELQYIYEYDIIKKEIQEFVDLPDKYIDLAIKLIIQNKGTLAPSKRKRFFSALSDLEIDEIEAIIKKTSTFIT